MTSERSEMIDELEDMKDDLEQVVGRLRQVEDGMTDRSQAGRLAQVRAGIETAISDNHEWVGRSDYTLAGTIDELLKAEAEEEEEEK